MPKRHRLLLGGAAVLVLLGAGVPPGGALYEPHDSVVSANPADTTPNVADGKVDAILPMGNRVYVAGSFTGVSNAGESRVIPRHGLFALDPATNRVDESFVADFDVNPDPTQDRAVEALAPAPGGNALFAGGDFTTLNGAATHKLVKLDAATGTPDPTFAVTPNAAVKDTAIRGSRLFLAGPFATVDGQPRSGLAAVDAGTGVLDPDVAIAFTAPRQGNTPRVETIAVTPDGTTLVAAGNFTLVDGQTRWQVALIDVGSHPARVLDWQTNRFDDEDQTGQYHCASAFDSFPRDVDISPDGRYFVIVVTGAYTSRGALCDTASRWELSARGSDLQPTWADFTGGDSFTSVAVTGAAVYVGGHMRWMNNPISDGSNANAKPGPGSVTREGLAALDPASGLPLPWNPGRLRGEGAWALASNADGLWMGSDTDKVGGWTAPGCGSCEVHQKLAFFPLAGGTPPASPPAAVGLPANLYTIGAAGLVERSFDGAALGPSTLLGPAADAGHVRGAFWIGGRLYEGRDDGRLLRWNYDGTTFGPLGVVNLRGVPASYQTLNALAVGFPIATVTGMFYDNGRLYYTQSGDKHLYYRYFLSQPDVADDVVGSQVLVASGDSDGLDWSHVQGMTAAGGAIFWSEGGDLRKVDFAGGRPNPATVTTVAAGANLDGRAMFLLPSSVAAAAPSSGSGGPTGAAGAGPAGAGYWMLDAGGGVSSFGAAAPFGDATVQLGRGIAADIEPTPSRRGYWIVDEGGRVYAFGDARYLGGVGAGLLARGEKVTSLSTTPSGAGYWIFTTRGRVVPFGDARSYGDMAKVTLNGPVLDSIPTPSGLGYYMVAADGGIFAFGDARFAGSMGGIRLNAPVQSLVPDPDGHGYWLVASDGGVFAFDAPFRGSMGNVRLNQPVTGMVPFGDGYLMVAEDGGIFDFSDRPFLGSLGGHPPAHPIVAVAGFG